MKYGLLTFLFFITIRSFGTHIVGGEIQLNHIDSFSYELSLIQYFDDVNGEPEAEDQSILLYIFRKSDDRIMSSVRLFNQGSTLVPFTNPDCAIDRLVTRRIVYSTEITFDSEQYRDPDGYYIVWERCCRNEVITNIKNPGAVGQAFYLEFPPMIRKGRPFLNSSPVLSAPFNDYACVNHFYYADFSGTDADGDSLVYSIVQPLAGFSSPAADNIIPPPRPEPYPVVQWNPGITTGNSVPGNPPLAISRDGLLTVMPSQAGLFVFSVKCEEYRNGEKLGEVRREYQMLVVDCPDPGSKPVLTVRTPGSDAYTDSPDTLLFSSEEAKCYELMVRDKDGKENLQFKIQPVNFEADLQKNLSVISGKLSGPEDAFLFQFCFPDCPAAPGRAQVVDIIAADDACPLPLLDTVRLVIYIEPPPNSRPAFDTLTSSIRYDLDAGETINLNLAGSDPDGDDLEFFLIPAPGQPNYNFNFGTEFPSPGSFSLDFTWDADCRKYDFGVFQNFTFLMLLEDNDFCGITSPDSMRLDIHVNLPENGPPVIRSDMVTQPAEVRVLDSLTLNIYATDPDGDMIHVYAVPDGFDLQESGFTLFDHQAAGVLTAPFEWKLDCGTVDPFEREFYLVSFVAEDNDLCGINQGDTLMLEFKALLPENRSPTLDLLNMDSPEIEVIAGDSLYLQLEGLDPDADSVFISFHEPSGKLEAAGAVFNPVEGIGKATATFYWQTDCSLLSSGNISALYSSRIIVRDNKCLVPKADTLDLEITVSNREVNYDEIFIPNVFTPNADGFNDFFTVDDLPEDNCDHSFQSISIYNRDGSEVFFTKQREFRWYAQNVRNGVYFYHIKYTGKEYKGYLQVLY